MSNLRLTKDTTIMTSVRLPPELHEKLRLLAFNRRVSIHSLMLQAIEQYLGREQANG